jgi:hypothetical protein
MDAGPDYFVVLRPEPGSAPPIVRLRRFLKLALRLYGLRAVDYRELRPASRPSQDEPKAPRQQTLFPVQ